MFKRGDWVICVDISGCSVVVKPELGKKYEVVDVGSSSIRIKINDESTYGYFQYRFKLANCTKELI